MSPPTLGPAVGAVPDCSPRQHPSDCSHKARGPGYTVVSPHQMVAVPMPSSEKMRGSARMPAGQGGTCWSTAVNSRAAPLGRGTQREPILPAAVCCISRLQSGIGTTGLPRSMRSSHALLLAGTPRNGHFQWPRCIACVECWPPLGCTRAPCNNDRQRWRARTESVSGETEARPGSRGLPHARGTHPRPEWPLPCSRPRPGARAGLRAARWAPHRRAHCIGGALARGSLEWRTPMLPLQAAALSDEALLHSASRQSLSQPCVTRRRANRAGVQAARQTLDAPRHAAHPRGGGGSWSKGS